MKSNEPMALGSRLYALLLYLYPSSFRREYGESMLQLFNDQSRAVSGAGGNAMLWLKTLRDLVQSVPAAYSTDGQRRSGAVGAAFIWGLIVVLANPWIWIRQGEPSIAGLWILGVWPLAAIAWVALTIAKRQQRVGGT